MSEREQLREALEKWKREHVEALDIADVLAVLDQQGWVSPAEYAAHRAFYNLTVAQRNHAWAESARHKAERDAALRGAARYEPTLACLKRLADGWALRMRSTSPDHWCWYRRGGGGMTLMELVDATEAEQEVMASLYRQVTEGEEG